jgi:RNA polymerase sigma-70 factor, ECF subfamily
MTGGVVMLTISEANFSGRAVGSGANEVLRLSSRKMGLALGPGASDAELIKAIARGSRRAMELLYGRYSVRAYRCALRITGNAEIAEDIVSEVFLDIWRQADGFEARSQVSTWLLAITRNKSLSAVRRRTEDQLDDQAAAEIEDPADDPEMTAEKDNRSVAIRKCMMQLSAAHREVVDLVYYHEKSVEEVSRIVGVPASTVKTRMFYARHRMRELLHAAGYEHP